MIEIRLYELDHEKTLIPFIKQHLKNIKCLPDRTYKSRRYDIMCCVYELLNTLILHSKSIYDSAYIYIYLPTSLYGVVDLSVCSGDRMVIVRY